MSFAQGSRSGLSYVVESSYGTTPGSPSMIAIPLNSHSLELMKDGIESAEIRDDRMVDVFRHGNKKVQGDIEVDFRADDYDDLLESAFFGQFTTAGVLKAGVTPQYLSMEDRALDINQYRLFTGCAVNTFNLTVATNSMIKAKFGMVGKDMAVSGSSVDAVVTAGSGNKAFDSFTGTITEGGSGIATVTSVELNIDNGLNHTFVVGASTSPQLEYGRAKVSGTIQAYFADATLITKFVNETESALVFSLTDGATGNTYTFTVPRIKYSGANVPLAGEGSRVVSLPFVGLYKTSDATCLKLVKT